MQELAFLDATAQADLVRRKKISASELIEYAIARIEQLKCPVLLGPVELTERSRRGVLQDHDPALAGRLEAADIPVAITAGGDSRFLALRAAQAMPHGLSEAGALSAITLNAARAAGVGGRLGSLEPGKDADFVLWTGHPLRSGSRVQRVFINGEEVQL